MLPPEMDRLDHGKNDKNRDIGISEVPNIDEVDGIHPASPRGLIGRKTEPLDYILMFCSANVPGIPHKFNSGIWRLPFF